MAGLTLKQQDVIVQIQPLLKTYPWILRVTEQKKFTGPVLEVCERQATDKGTTRLKEYGRIYNGSLATCKPAIQYIMSQVTDPEGRPLNLQALLDGRISYRGNIPLDITAGAKLALLFKLHPQVRNQQRIELMAWRIERFSREEALYWLTKVSVPTYGKRSIEWAKSGLRLMIAGQQKDLEEVGALLLQLRH